jgi:hypothetical protein
MTDERLPKSFYIINIEERREFIEPEEDGRRN